MPLAQKRSHFRKDLWLGIWRFSVGMTGISLVSLILMQTDKIILSKILTLENFGYYNLAGTVASGVTIVITPIFTSVFPKFSELVSRKEEQKLTELYHKSAQLLGVLVLPICVTLSLFSKDILLLWTGNLEIANKAYLMTSLLTIGTSLNGLMNVPYALQLAYGWTKLAFSINVVAIVFLIPSLFFLTSLYGGVGASIVWAVLNGSYVLIGIRFMHIRLLRGELLKWYLADIIRPMFGALTVGLMMLFIFKSVYSQPFLNIWSLALVASLTFLGSMLTTDTTSLMIKKILLKQTV